LRVKGFMFASFMTRMKPPDVGDVIADKYELVHLLGRGATGEVWLAHHKTLTEGVAIKLLSHTIWAGGEEKRVQAAARFRFEAQIAARLARKTRHIVRVTDHGETDGIAYLVMELLEGVTLETKLAQGEALSPVEVQKLVSQVARALDYAHAEGVLHRDLKPSNLFLTRGEDGEMLVKVLDFGIAQMMRGRASSGSFSTDRDLIFGTPGYLSPEQALGHADLDGRCDLWALATIAYESLTKELPIAGASVSELINAVRFARTVPLRQYRPDLPQRVGAFFEQAFLPEVDARFATAAELTRAFDAAFTPERPRDIVVAPEAPASSQASLVPPAPARSEGPESPRRHRPTVTALWLAALLATGFVGANWRSLARGLDSLVHIRVALAAPESPPAKAPVGAPAASEATPVEMPPLETVREPATPEPIQKVTVTVGRRPHSTIATRTSAVPAADRLVVTGVARMSADGNPALSTRAAETTTVKPECEPPYVVDATTGKKHWNLDCI
jgi:serine/threonine protein kinase